MSHEQKTAYKNVYKRDNTSTYYYSAYVIDNGAKVRKRRYGFKTPEEANEARLKLIEEYEHRESLKINKKDFKYLIEKYLNFRKTQVKITTYHHMYMLSKKYHLTPYKNFSIEQFCKQSNLEKFRKKLVDHNISTEQKNKILSLTRNIIRYGGVMNLVSFDLINRTEVATTKIIDHSKRKKDENENYWTQDQFQTFLDNIDPDSKWYIFFAVFGHLGCRIGEIRGLQNKHVDLENKTITIEQQATSNAGTKKTIITPPKTQSSYRTIELGDDIVELLRDYIKKHKEYDPERFLFFNNLQPVGKSTIVRIFDETTKKAGLPHITLHGIRHSNCTWLLSGLTNPQHVGHVSRRLGHASTKMTLDLYFHIHKEEDPAILETLKFQKKKKK